MICLIPIALHFTILVVKFFAIIDNYSIIMSLFIDLMMVLIAMCINTIARHHNDLKQLRFFFAISLPMIFSINITIFLIDIVSYNYFDGMALGEFYFRVEKAIVRNEFKNPIKIGPQVNVPSLSKTLPGNFEEVSQLISSNRTDRTKNT